MGIGFGGCFNKASDQHFPAPRYNGAEEQKQGQNWRHAFS
jgi:hypothetical protein